MKCLTPVAILGCYKTGPADPGTTVTIHYSYAEVEVPEVPAEFAADGTTVVTPGVPAHTATTLVSTIFTDAAGQPIDTSGGTVTPGACMLVPVPVEPDGDPVHMCYRDDAVSESRGIVVRYTPAGTSGLIATAFEVDGSPILNFNFANVVKCDTPAAGNCCEPCAAPLVRGVVTAWGA
jgi:hypothetical protein